MMDEKTFKRLWKNKRVLYVRDPENNYNQIKIGEVANLTLIKAMFLNDKLHVIIPVDEYFKMKGIE